MAVSKFEPPPVPDTKVMDTVIKKVIHEEEKKKSEILKTPDQNVQKIMMTPKLDSTQNHKKKVSWESDKQKSNNVVNQNHLAWWSKVLKARKEAQKGVGPGHRQYSYKQKMVNPTVKGKLPMVQSGTKKSGHFSGQNGCTKGWKPPNKNSGSINQQKIQSPGQQPHLSGEGRAFTGFCDNCPELALHLNSKYGQ